MPKGQAPSLMGRALRYLSRREHSRQELRKKLLVYAETEDEVDELLIKLEKQSWLSDERYAEGLARRKSDRYGSLKIVDELKQQSINPHTVSKIKDDRQKQSEEMMKLYKKHGTNPLASCFPLLARAPIFFALFTVACH